MRDFLRRYPHLLEQVYQLTEKTFIALDPLIKRVGYERTDRLISLPEHWAKTVAFGCQMCGQCVLHSTGMTCPMNCPKNLRNGPCGGVRPNGHCEVKPEMRCVWVVAYETSLGMPVYGHEMLDVEPPVDRRLEGQSAWINMLTGVDKQTPPGWVPVGAIDVVPQRVPQRVAQQG
jgi:hypothetical protein